MIKNKPIVILSCCMFSRNQIDDLHTFTYQCQKGSIGGVQKNPDGAFSKPVAISLQSHTLFQVMPRQFCSCPPVQYLLAPFKYVKTIQSTQSRYVVIIVGPRLTRSHEWYVPRRKLGHLRHFLSIYSKILHGESIPDPGGSAYSRSSCSTSCSLPILALESI